MLERVQAGQFDAVSRAMQKSCHIVRGNVPSIIEGPWDTIDDLKYVQTFQNVGKLHNAEISWDQPFECLFGGRDFIVLQVNPFALRSTKASYWRTNVQFWTVNL